MSVGPIPVVILGGSDRKPAALPRGSDKHPLSGYKGARIRFEGEPLVSVIAKRLDASGGFAPIYVAGPRRIYDGMCGTAVLIDTDGTFGENIQAATETIRAACPGYPIAFISCDILPGVDELRSLAAAYAAAAPNDLWFPLVRVPEDASRLGDSAWKPRYGVAPGPGEAPEETLPGHLVIADPAALRLQFIYRLFQIGYRTRNRSVNHRRSAMIRGVLWELLYQDLLHVLGFRLPTLTLNVLGSGLPTGRLLRDGQVTRQQLENTVRKIFAKKLHRRNFPERRVLLPAVDTLSLAIDVDTVEEARALGAELSENSA